MSDQDKKDHNAILEALKKLPNRTKAHTKGNGVGIEKSKKTNPDLKVGLITAKNNAQKQEAYLLGVQMGQENVMEHLIYGPCSADCPMTVFLAGVLNKDTYKAFKPFRSPEEQSK